MLTTGEKIGSDMLAQGIHRAHCASADERHGADQRFLTAVGSIWGEVDIKGGTDEVPLKAILPQEVTRKRWQARTLFTLTIREEA
jgi:hypothetical protein